jgi:hypothetical protein
MMADAVRRDQFIYDSKIALVESLIEDMPEDGLALNG